MRPSNANRDLLYDIQSTAIAGAGDILLRADTDDATYSHGLKLSGDASAFTGKIAMAPGSAVEPQNFTLTIANAFGGTVESLPSAANVTEVRFNSGANAGGLVVSSTAVPEALKTKLVVYGYDVAASDRPLVTFPAGTAVNAAEFTVRHASSVGAEGTAFKSVRAVTNPDGTVSLYPNIEYTLAFEGLEGASNPNAGKTFTVDDELILVAPGKRDGYVFGGWRENGTPISYIPTNTVGNKTLTATWVATNDYQLIEYIATTNCQFLDTGVTPRNAHFGFALDFWDQCYVAPGVEPKNAAKVAGAADFNYGMYNGFYLGNWNTAHGQFVLSHENSWPNGNDFDPMMTADTRVIMSCISCPGYVPAGKTASEYSAYGKYRLLAVGENGETSSLQTADHMLWINDTTPVYTDKPQWFKGPVFLGGVNFGDSFEKPENIGYQDSNYMRFYRVTFYYDDIVLYDAIPAVDGNGHVGLLRVDGTEGELFAYSKTIQQDWFDAGNEPGAEFATPHFIVNGNGGEPEETAVVKVLDETDQPALTDDQVPYREGFALMGFTNATGRAYRLGADRKFVDVPHDGDTLYARWLSTDDYTLLDCIDNGSDPAKAGYVPLTGFKPKKDQAISMTFGMNRELMNVAQMLFAVSYADDTDKSRTWQWNLNYTHHGGAGARVLSYAHGTYNGSSFDTNAYVPITNPDSVGVGGVHTAVFARTLAKMSVDGEAIEHDIPGVAVGDALMEFPHDFGNDLTLFCSANAAGNSLGADGMIRAPALAKTMALR